MRRKSLSPASGSDEFSDEPPDDAHVETITPISSASDQPDHSATEGPATAPGWTKRLTARDKVMRAAVITLVVIAALVALLPHPTITLPPDVARLLTPAPTQTPQPGKFTTGPLEPIAGPPVQTAYFYNLVPSLADPDTAYACLFLTDTKDGRQVFKSAAGQLWITHDAGHTWLQATLPIVIDADCTVSPALDGSHRVTLRLDNVTLDQDTQPCMHSKYLLSEDDGATWRLIQHTSILPATPDGGTCLLWSTERHLFMYSVSYSGPGDEYLERSDDGGLTWRRADAGLTELNADWIPQPLDTTEETIGALVGARPDLWISHDAGASWQHIGPIAPVSRSIVDLIGEIGLGKWPNACHCLFAASIDSQEYIRGRDIYVSRDYTHWSHLPPLPIKGTSLTPVTGTGLTQSGVYEVLGQTADGRLLAFGAEPGEGALATPAKGANVHGPPPRLWAWNTHTSRWEVAETRLPCGDLQTCDIYVTGAAPVVQANGVLVGTIFWLTQVKGAGESQPSAQTTFRLFVPAS